MTDTQRQELMALGRAMSAGDISVMRAALEQLAGEQPTLLTTTPGSNNDRLWSTMVALGWMSAAEPLEIPHPTKVFVVNRDAKEALHEFVADRERAEAMTRTLNEMRKKIPPVLIDAVRELNGTPTDLAIMLAGIVESTMRRAIHDELHDEFLREVARIAESMRSM